VLIIEAMAQLGAVLVLKKFPEEKRMAYFAGIEKAKFKKIVVPGDRLDMELKIVRIRNTFVVMEGKAFVDGKIAAQAIMSSMLAK
jgi:3-hydroxyacyl-[acyl-carrier-protein] dehydratase